MGYSRKGGGWGGGGGGCWLGKGERDVSFLIYLSRSTLIFIQMISVFQNGRTTITFFNLDTVFP